MGIFKRTQPPAPPEQGDTPEADVTGPRVPVASIGPQPGQPRKITESDLGQLLTQVNIAIEQWKAEHGIPNIPSGVILNQINALAQGIAVANHNLPLDRPGSAAR